MPKSIIDMTMVLSEHFVLGEFLKSAKAEKYNINNTPLKCHIMRLKNLAVRSLEPIRQHLGLPIQVTSGYRCPELNMRVGGVPTSQHMKGEAADLTIPVKHRPFSVTNDEQAARLLLMYAKQYADYDQLILEHYKKGDKEVWWLHISCRIDYRKNRHQIIKDLIKR